MPRSGGLTSLDIIQSGIGEVGISTDLLLPAVQILLGAVFVLTGVLKLIGVDQMVESFERWRYPQWFRVVTGLVEMTGGLGFIVGILVPISTLVGGALLSGAMLGAIYTHVLRVGDPMPETARPTILLVLVLIVLGINV